MQNVMDFDERNISILIITRYSNDWILVNENFPFYTHTQKKENFTLRFWYHFLVTIKVIGLANEQFHIKFMIHTY